MRLVPFVLLACLGSHSIAAELEVQNSERCRLRINGPIERGDFAKLEKLKDKFVIFNGESTIDSVVCLNSPGGSVTEGLKIARFFYDEGVSTYVGKGHQCYSICAIIFMMGNITGPELGRSKRTLHVDGRLGFHRPYLTLEDAEAYNSDDINSAFDWGVETVMQFMQLATLPERWSNDTMIPAELVQIMLETSPSKIFPITTVREVLRWKISLDGVAALDEAFTTQKFWACENAIASSAGPFPLDPDSILLGSKFFGLKPVPRFQALIALEPTTASSASGHTTGSLRDGYVAAGCTVKVRDGSVAVCGIDQNTDTQIGDCRTNDYRYWSKHLLLHPKTEISMLAYASAFNADASRVAKCKVRNSEAKLIDDELCFQFVSLMLKEEVPLVQHLALWPSGARTLIEVPTQEYDRPVQVKINGNDGTVVDGANGNHCIGNSASGNTLCISGL